MDRTAPILPLRPGIPEKQTHDYKRNGTTTLFAALKIATVLVTDRCFQQHTNEDEVVRRLVRGRVCWATPGRTPRAVA